MKKGIFVTGTDTGIGKTVAACCIIRALRLKGVDCGVMKPVQCAGSDSRRLMRAAGVRDQIDLINPFYAKYPYAPVTAFRKEKIGFNKNKIIAAFARLSQRHQFMVVEGAGGLLVPIRENYFISDLVLDLGLALVIVASSSLGTINHTLLSVAYARARKITIAGIIFNNLSKDNSMPEKTNPKIIQKICGLAVLGIIPYISDAARENKFRGIKININKILNG